MKKILFSLFAIAVSLPLAAQDNSQIKSTELREHVYYLSSDDLEGRKPGTEGDSLSIQYISEQYRNAGISPVNGSYIQQFEVISNIILGDQNHLEYDDTTYKVEKDFMPFAFSSAETISSGMVFAGYGFNFSNDSLYWNDYEGLDASGKIVLLLRGEPMPESDNSPFIDHARDRDKVITARDHGAIGVIFVSGNQWDAKDRLVSLTYDRASAVARIPVLQIKREVADRILEESGKTIEAVEQSIIKEMKPIGFAIAGNITITTDLHPEKLPTANVMGMVKGSDPSLNDEYIVIGAHYDHLGMGGPGSGSRMPDTTAVHNGADDNASGVSGIIEIAEELQLNRENLKRSVIVVAFGAEEMGLLGSKYFVKNPPVDLKSIKAMVNFDMIGRLDNETRNVLVGGTKTSEQGETILDKLKENTSLNLSYSPEGYGPSDHASFYGENIPVFYLNTGVHQDYHTPVDDAELLNYEGQKEVADFAYQLVRELANMEDDLVFREAGPKEQGRNYMRLKVTLGIMPDFTASDNNGLGVGGVRKDGPADKGGMLKGDLITALNGKPVGNIYEYMNRLKKLEPGQIITVDVIRDGQKKVLLIQL